MYKEKNTSLQDAASAINLASAFYRRQRTDEDFKHFDDEVVELAGNLLGSHRSLDIKGHREDLMMEVSHINSIHLMPTIGICTTN